MADALHRQTDAEARHETEAARLDRNYAELLQELRVAETGVQILFAFMLSIAFQQRFATIDSFQRAVYVITLACCTISIAFLVTPVAFHRLVFRKGLKDELVEVTSLCAIVGTSFLLLSVLSGVLLILDYVVGRTFAVTSTALAAGLFGALWIALPLWRRAHLEDDPDR
jgi:uncharacterized protein DUF6328